jgi:ribosomal protein L11 methyltransferase
MSEPTRFAAYRMTCDAAAEDDAAAVLWDLGTHGVQVEGGPDGRLVLLAYFPEGTVASDLEGPLAGIGVAEIQSVPVPDIDWVARFRESFRAFDVGGFRIVPAWENAPRGPRVLLVDPGRAFGTGTHESTALCLAALEAVAAEAPLGRTLDLGAGTGLLALAASRLGAASVVAIDVDPEAARSAGEHARLNGVVLHSVVGDGGRALRPEFDLVLANLTAPLLRERADEIAGLLRPRGRLITAGFLDEDVDAVRSAFAALQAQPATRANGWASLLLTRR